MTFEEDFPSLKWSWEFIDGGQHKISAVRTEDIQKHCLDKAKVKEVITAYLCKYICKKDKKIRNYRDGILKELGLE